MNQDSDENPSKSGNGHELLKSAIDSHRSITFRALGLVPVPQRLLIYTLWTVSLLGLIGSFFLLYAKSETYAFILLIICVLAISISVIVQNKSRSTTTEQLGRLAEGQISDPSWARAVLKMPIEAERLGTIQAPATAPTADTSD